MEHSAVCSLDLGRCALISKSANFNTTKHSDSPRCGLLDCVFVCALPSVEIAWWAVHFSCNLPNSNSMRYNIC